MKIIKILAIGKNINSVERFLFLSNLEYIVIHQARKEHLGGNVYIPASKAFDIKYKDKEKYKIDMLFNMINIMKMSY